MTFWISICTISQRNSNRWFTGPGLSFRKAIPNQHQQTNQQSGKGTCSSLAHILLAYCGIYMLHTRIRLHTPIITFANAKIIEWDQHKCLLFDPKSIQTFPSIDEITKNKSLLWTDATNQLFVNIKSEQSNSMFRNENIESTSGKIDSYESKSSIQNEVVLHRTTLIISAIQFTIAGRTSKSTKMNETKGEMI